MKIMKSTTVVASILLLAVSAANAQVERDDEAYHADFIYGVPADPTEAWVLSRGGRIYDNWYSTQGLEGPEDTHSAWPASNTKKSGAVTTRCKSCHGWDYRGADGKYASGSYTTGIQGVIDFAGGVDDLLAVLRGDTHGYSEEMIPQEQAEYLATFMAKGLIDMNAVIDFETGEVKGDAMRGAPVYQTTCAACHGFDGRALDWGDADEPGFVGTEAVGNPWEVLHKIRNGHPGVEMVSLSAFPMQTSLDVLAYTRTLPEK